EADWKAGRRPRIEDDLPDAGDPRRAPLLEALLRVECQLLGRTGEGPTPEGYRRRFPGEEEVVAAVFAARAGGPADAEGPPGEAPAVGRLAEVLGSRMGPTSCCRSSARVAWVPSTWPSRSTPSVAASP